MPPPDATARTADLGGDAPPEPPPPMTGADATAHTGDLHGDAPPEPPPPMPPPDASARTADLGGDAPPEPPPPIPPPDATARTASPRTPATARRRRIGAPPDATARGGSPRTPATARRRRWVGAAALAALATLAAVAAVAAPAAAHPEPARDDPDPDKVWPPGVAVDPSNRTQYDYVRVPRTQTVTPAHDFVRVPFVRVPPGGTVDLHYRDNDSVRFKVCPTTNTPEQCRTVPSLHEPAGGTCGDAVRYANGDAGAHEVLGHHHVITLCSGVYSLGGLGMLSGGENAGVKSKRGPITGTHTDGTAPRGVIEVEGKKLGVAEAEYCMTARPHPCRRWARIDIVVEPDGWTDARVVGVDEAYRLELNWQDRKAVLYDGVGNVVGTMCCISDLRYWTFDLRLPVMLGSERITRGRDAVVFYDATDTEVGRMQCLPRYCEQIVPKNPTVTSAGTIGVDAEVVGRNLHVTLWDNPDLIGVQAGSRGSTTTLITYCLAHWQQRCDASTCAKATYRGAPNLTLAPWMNVVPSSAYVADTNCPAPATVRIEVRDVTPPGFDLGDFSPATEQDPPDPADPADPEDPPDWQYRPLPAQFDPASTSADKTYWCFPGRFLDSAIGDLEGDAGRWVDNPATQHVARTRQIRFTRYMAGEDAAGNNVPEWAALPDRIRDGVTNDVTNRDVLIPQIVDREYEALRRDPGEFPERDPTLGEVWRWAAEEVYNDFADADFADNFEEHYLAVTDPALVQDPIPTPLTPPNLDEFIRDYVTPGGQYHDAALVAAYVTDRDGEVLDRYDATFAREWERGPLWQGLLRSAYRGADGGLEQGVGRVYLVDRPLLENPGAQSRSCLAEGLVDMQITGVWGTYPGADNWGKHLCGYGLPTTSTATRPSNERDPDCPDNAPVPVRGDASLPAIWLRDDPGTPEYDPSLGEAWERALEAVTPCVEPPQCDTWAPPIPGYYQVRVEITRRPDNPFKDACGSIPSFGDPRPGVRAPRPECAYHHWLTESTGADVASKGWTDYWGPPPDTKPAPTIIFHDLIWVTDVRVDAVG